MPNEKVGFVALHVGLCQHADIVAAVQRELMFVVDNYISVTKTTRLGAQIGMVNKLTTVQAQQKAALKGLDKTIKQENPSLSFDQRTPIFSGRAAAIRHQYADPVVQGFEVSYKETRTSKADTLRRIMNMAKFIGAEGYVDLAPKHGNQDNCLVRVNNGIAWIDVIELWFGQERFIAKGDGIYSGPSRTATMCATAMASSSRVI